jgi:NADP-dependent 3-hydroxy acid dehydrogenase YdfG
MNEPDSPRPLGDKVAIVTGATSGIGLATARMLAAAGARVVLIGRTPSQLESACDSIRQDGSSTQSIVADLRKGEVLGAVVEQVAQASGRLDILVNNAGVLYPGDIVQGDASQWREMFEVNVMAPLIGARAAISAMRRTGRPGHIVMVTSSASRDPTVGVYSATKAAIEMIGSALAIELENDSIRMTKIVPGLVATRLLRHYSQRSHLAQIDAKLFLDPTDVARAILFAVTQAPEVSVEEILVRPQADIRRQHQHQHKA